MLLSEKHRIEDGPQALHSGPALALPLWPWAGWWAPYAWIPYLCFGGPSWHLRIGHTHCLAHGGCPVSGRPGWCGSGAPCFLSSFPSLWTWLQGGLQWTACPSCTPWPSGLDSDLLGLRVFSHPAPVQGRRLPPGACGHAFAFSNSLPQLLASSLLPSHPIPSHLTQGSLPRISVPSVMPAGPLSALELDLSSSQPGLCTHIQLITDTSVSQTGQRPDPDPAELPLRRG